MIWNSYDVSASEFNERKKRKREKKVNAGNFVIASKEKIPL